MRIALGAKQKVIFSSKWFVHQRSTAFGTLEAIFMPVSVFVGEVLTVAPDWHRTVLTTVSKQILVTLRTILRVFFQNILLSEQTVLAVVAVESFHGHDEMFMPPMSFRRAVG